MRLLFVSALMMVAVGSHAAPSSRTDEVGPCRRYGPWESCRIGGGGYLQEVVFSVSDPSRLYLLSDVGGVFRSDDGGTSWRMLHGGLPPRAASYSPRSLLIDPQDADRLVLAAGDKWTHEGDVWISEDGGVSWRSTLKARFEGDGHFRNAGDVLARNPHQSKWLIAGPVGSRLQTSQDGGEHWRELPSPILAPSHVMFDRGGTGRIWVCSQPWTTKAARADEASRVESGFFASEDDGNTWRRLCAEVPTEFVQDPERPGVLYGLFAKGQVKRSRDGGVTWDTFVAGLPPIPAKWNEQADGFYAAIALAGHDIILGGHGAHFYRLDQEVWKPVAVRQVDEDGWWGRMQPGARRHCGAALGFLGVKPGSPDQWFFTDWYALYRSSDGGLSWKLSLDGIEMTVVHAVAQDPFSVDTVHVGVADVGYFRSANAGASFTRIQRDISNNVKCIAPSLIQEGRFYATGPRTWDWIANQIFISDDHGQAWRRSPMKGLPDMLTHRCNTIVAGPTFSNEVWLAVSGPITTNQGGLYWSEDGGLRWQWVPGLPACDRFFRSEVFCGNAEVSVSPDTSVVVSSIGTKRLLARPAGMTQWLEVKLPPGAVPNTVAANPSISGCFFAALGDAGLWRSGDGGVTWSNVVARDVWHVVVDVRCTKRVAAVMSDRIALSCDGGWTWQAMSNGLPYRHPRDVVAFAGNRVFVGTGGNGVFRIPIEAVSGLPAVWAGATPGVLVGQCLGKDVKR